MRKLIGKRLLTLGEAAEHYGRAYFRGFNQGDVKARQRIVEELLNDPILTTQLTTDQLQLIIERVEK